MRLVSLEFFVFFALLLAVYNSAPRKMRWGVLLLGSLAFYLAAGIFAFIYIIIASLSSYAFALILQKRKKEGGGFALTPVFYVAVFALISAWLVLKLLSNRGEVILPLGISFYSLRIIAYLVDVRRGRLAPERNFFRYLLFVCYFPIILQGPIVCYGEISSALYSGRRASGEESLSGLILSLWGIFKKTVVSNALASPLATIAAESERYSGAYVLFLLCFYSAEIYCDFSGGIDIVRGASLMLGIPIKRNFDRPFSSTSLREFWNRWHISLGEYFERYVFYPLSLSRPMQRLSKSARARLGARRGRRIPLYIATMTTWLLTGLWHGFASNYIAWGVINGVLVLFSSELAPVSARIRAKIPFIEENTGLWTIFMRIRVFLTIGAVRLLDLYGSVGLTFKMLSTPLYETSNYADIFQDLPSLISIPRLFGVIAALSLVLFIGKREIKAENIAKSPIKSAAAVFALVLFSITFGAYGAGFEAGDFIYSRF